MLVTFQLPSAGPGGWTSPHVGPVEATELDLSRTEHALSS
jgi:hypothetical protein